MSTQITSMFSKGILVLAQGGCDSVNWWAWWITLAAVRQIWPDGNHRTAMVSAEIVAGVAGFKIALDVSTISWVDRLRVRSKGIITEWWQREGLVLEADLLKEGNLLLGWYLSLAPWLKLVLASDNLLNFTCPLA